MKAPFRILVVCLGNICRSPMAEGMLRHKLAAAGLGERVVVDSAGTGSWHVGDPPDPRAVLVCAENDVSIDRLRARQIAVRDFHDFDLILCADRAVLRHLSAIAPRESMPKIALLLHWAGHGADAEVPDPYTGTIEDFRSVHRLLDAALPTMLTRLQLPA